MTVTHIPEDEATSVDLGSGESNGLPKDNGTYRRIISLESADKRIDIIGV